MAETSAFSFIADVNKVQTMVDGGIRVTLNLSETAIAAAALLMECQRSGIVLEINCKTTENKPATAARKSRMTRPETDHE